MHASCFLRALLFYILLSLPVRTVLADNTSAIPSANAFQWHFAHNLKAKGVILILHGLNLNPDKMLPMANRLNLEGYHVLNGRLSGHRGNETEFVNANRNQWLADMELIYTEANLKSQQDRIPLYFIGYSLGSTIAIDFSNAKISKNSTVQNCFHKSIFFAPALSLNLKTLLIKFATYLPFDIIIPSVARKDYRANSKGTPIAGYAALFESINHIEKDGVLDSNPTLIIIDPEDELVSFSGLKKFTEDMKIKNWSFLPVTNRNSKMTDGKYHHLVIDSISLGEQEWDKAIQAILLHIK